MPGSRSRTKTSSAAPASSSSSSSSSSASAQQRAASPNADVEEGELPDPVVEGEISDLLWAFAQKLDGHVFAQLKRADTFDAWGLKLNGVPPSTFQSLVDEKVVGAVQVNRFFAWLKAYCPTVRMPNVQSTQALAPPAQPVAAPAAAAAQPAAVVFAHATKEEKRTKKALAAGTNLLATIGALSEPLTKSCEITGTSALDRYPNTSSHVGQLNAYFEVNSTLVEQILRITKSMAQRECSSEQDALQKSGKEIEEILTVCKKARFALYLHQSLYEYVVHTFERTLRNVPPHLRDNIFTWEDVVELVNVAFLSVRDDCGMDQQNHDMFSMNPASLAGRIVPVLVIYSVHGSTWREKLMDAAKHSPKIQVLKNLESSHNQNNRGWTDYNRDNRGGGGGKGDDKRRRGNRGGGGNNRDTRGDNNRGDPKRQKKN